MERMTLLVDLAMMVALSQVCSVWPCNSVAEPQVF